MEIFIPTYGRHDKQHTFNHLPKSLQEHTTLVVQKREANMYTLNPVRETCAGILVLPDSIQTITPARQFIMNHAKKKGIDKLVMLDDDLRFDARRMDDNGKFLVANDKQVEKLFKMIEKQLDDYAHVGVLAREGGNRVLEPYRIATRMMRVLAYDAEIFHREKIKFDRLPLQEDFDVTLQLLRKGFPNYLICNFVQGQGSSGAKGGCSHFRTMAMQNENAERLAELHKGFVTVVEKETKGAWGGGKRKDVMIQWKKAYESSQHG